jgi:low temperature requirement protein LtrA
MTSSQSILRNRNENDEKVSYSELFFDLIYVFSVTQLSHYLLKNLTLGGILETLVLWFAVYIAWDYTSWFTNFFNPENIKIRIVLFILMLLGVIMASSIPESFSYRGFVFALSYVIMQIGRSLYIVWKLGKKHHLTPTFYPFFILFISY